MLTYSPSTGGFYSSEIHGENIPADAVKITERQHQKLLHGQAQGHKIAAGPSGPVLAKAKVTKDVALATAVRRVKSEARRRILAVASLETQSNDNAALALWPHDEPECQAAINRRQRINAIRAASNDIERDLNALAIPALTAFIAANAPWPNWEPTA